LKNAEEFATVQKEVADILQGRILVGHALWNDMKVLFLDHPKKCIRDTAKYNLLLLYCHCFCLLQFCCDSNQICWQRILHL